MFHMIEDPTAFLKERHRLLKQSGYLMIEDGHQSRDEARRKIKSAEVWHIESENKKYLKCRPLPRKEQKMMRKAYMIEKQV